MLNGIPTWFLSNKSYLGAIHRHLITINCWHSRFFSIFPSLFCLPVGYSFISISFFFSLHVCCRPMCLPLTISISIDKHGLVNPYDIIISFHFPLFWYVLYCQFNQIQNHCWAAQSQKRFIAIAIHYYIEFIRKYRVYLCLCKQIK